MHPDFTVLDGAPVALLRVSESGTITYANTVCRELLRSSAAGLIGRPVGEIAEAHGRSPMQALNPGSPDEQRLVVQLTRPDGHTFTSVAWVTPAAEDRSRWLRLEPVTAPNEADDTSLESLLSVASATVGAQQAWVLMDRGTHVEVMTELESDGTLEIRYFRGDGSTDLPLTRVLNSGQPYAWSGLEHVVDDFPDIDLSQFRGLQSGVVLPLLSPRGAVTGAIAWAWAPMGAPPVDMANLIRAADEVSTAVAARDRQRFLTESKREAAMLALRYRSVVEDLDEGVVMWQGRPHLVPTTLNPAAKRLLNVADPADLKGLQLIDDDGHRLAPGFMARHTAAALAAGHNGATDTIGMHWSGSTRWLRLRTRRPGLATGVEAVTILSDVTAEREREADLRHRMLHDPLTGLANRSLLMDRLDTALGRQRRGGATIGLIFVDLDGFKAVNDTMGHAAGDILLTRVAHILRAAVRPDDTVARIGGDEFVVVCEARTPATLRSIAGRILRAASTPVPVGSGEVQPALSLGLTLADDPSVSPGALLGQADRAMYSAKKAGGSTSRLYAATDSDHPVRTDSQASVIRDGLRDGQILPWYQPVVDLHSGKTVGVEALARWERDGAVLCGREFLDEVAELGLMSQIGEQLVRRALGHGTRTIGAPPTLHLNCSEDELANGDFAAGLMTALRDSGYTTDQVVVEVAEHVLRDASGAAVDRLNVLRRAGVRIAVDDFGAGRASLNDLVAFGVDVMKIDRTLVSKLPDHAPSNDIVRGILAAARALRMTAVAEGVETEAQRAWLEANGCELGQGFYLGAPTAEVSRTPA